MKRFTFIMGVSLLCFAPGAQAQEKPLTLEETLRRVYLQNPSILGARYNLDVTEEAYEQAKSGWKPRLSAEASINSTHIESGNFNSGDGATTKSGSVSLEQNVFRGFRTLSETEGAKHRIEADSSRVHQAEHEIFLRAVESYMNVIRDRMLLSLQRKNREVLAREKDSVRARFDAGDVTQTDLKQTEAQYSRAVAEDAIAQSSLQKSEADFEEITGLMAPENMVMPEIKFVFPETIDDMLKVAAMENPSLRRSRSEHEAAESDIGSAESDFYPQVTAFASHIKEYDPQPGIVDESETSALGLRARISLYEGGNTISRVRAAKSRANQKFVEIIEREKAVKGEIVSNWRRLKAYEAEIIARELEVEASKYANDGVKEEARLGERTVLDTLEAEQDVIESETALARARSERIITAYRLAAALGMLKARDLGITEVAFGEPAE